ncbi:MAG TPA: hypothetical protein VFD36_23305 [Kofleriaceae bacterium]|nr:hypothetical protein [Kofleriaceae bacterium]
MAALLLARHCAAPGKLVCTTCPRSSLRPEPPCTKGVTHNSMPHNSMPHNSMPHNGLTATALADNQALLDGLAQIALTDVVFSGPPPAVVGAPDWSALLAKPYAADLTQYIVSCALDPCERVQLPADGRLAEVQRQFPAGFPGELGLCGKSYNDWAAGNGGSAETLWTDGKPTDGCLQRVSACVLARVNAVEARVPISMRGDGMSPVSKVPVQTEYRENHGTPIQSFKACDRMCLWGDRLRRNCDWEPRHVGQCVRDLPPGAGGAPRKVRLAIDSSTPLRIRICKGIYGCDDVNPAHGAGAPTEPVFAHGRLATFPTYYGGQMVYQGEAQRGSSIEFDCPDDGPVVLDADGNKLRTGYYSVMLGTLDPGVSLTATADVSLTHSPQAGTLPFARHDAYPADEDQVFTFREGGFYGTLFSPPPRDVDPATCDRSPGDQYACASEIWTPFAATVTARHCAGPLSSRGCFGHPPGQCDVPDASLHCEAAAKDSGPRLYAACVGGQRWLHPYTTYLNHPCDLFATDEECLALLKDPEDVARRSAAESSQRAYPDERETYKKTN